MKTLPKIVVTLLAVVSLTACDAATVEKVVDGDTVDVNLDGETVRVRLLNIDTPESVDPDEPVECLGVEAAEYLKGLLPKGTEVGLEYDDEKTDSYGRTLAGVYLQDETLVNAEIARQGFAEPIVVGGNDRFYPEVADAAQEASDAGRGLFDPEVDCTLAADVAGYEQRADTVLAEQPGEDAGLDDLEKHAAAIAAALAAADQLRDGFDGGGVRVRAWGDQGRDRLAERVVAAEARLEKAKDRADQRATDEKDRIAEQKRRKAEERRQAEERREAAERAAAAEAERAAEERRAAERQAQQEAERSASSGSSGTSSGSGASSGSSGGSSSGGAYDPSYTGCRAYGDAGRWVDDQGRPYDKIDCTTKAIIG